MKKAMAILFAVMLAALGMTACAYAEGDVTLAVALANTTMKSTEDFTMNIEYNEDADVVVFTAKFTKLSYETFETLSGALNSEYKKARNNIAETTGALKNLLVTLDCPQNVVGALVTADGVPLALFYNDTDITSSLTGK